MQYDSESRNLGMQSRLRWILSPGSDLFVVVGGGWLHGNDDGVRPDEQQATIKFVHTFRF